MGDGLVMQSIDVLCNEPVYKGCVLQCREGVVRCIGKGIAHGRVS